MFYIGVTLDDGVVRYFKPPSDFRPEAFEQVVRASHAVKEDPAADDVIQAMLDSGFVPVPIEDFFRDCDPKLDDILDWTPVEPVTDANLPQERIPRRKPTRGPYKAKAIKPEALGRSRKMAHRHQNR